MSKELATLDKHTGKIAKVLGIDQTDTEEAVDAHETEARLAVQAERYQRAVLDLNTEFVRRREILRLDNLHKVAAISSQQEAAE